MLDSLANLLSRIEIEVSDERVALLQTISKTDARCFVIYNDYGLITKMVVDKEIFANIERIK